MASDFAQERLPLTNCMLHFSTLINSSRKACKQANNLGFLYAYQCMQVYMRT